MAQRTRKPLKYELPWIRRAVQLAILINRINMTRSVCVFLETFDECLNTMRFCCKLVDKQTRVACVTSYWCHKKGDTCWLCLCNTVIFACVVLNNNSSHLIVLCVILSKRPSFCFDSRYRGYLPGLNFVILCLKCWNETGV